MSKVNRKIFNLKNLWSYSDNGNMDRPDWQQTGNGIIKYPFFFCENKANHLNIVEVLVILLYKLVTLGL